MGKQGLQKQNRTDRILIAAALAILLIASGAFYFDGWMWGDRRGRGDKIGLLSNRVGDVRMKFEGDLKWQSAARGQDLIYNDSIFAGPGGQAKLALGESEMTVTENTLVVLRRQDQASFLNLSYGSLFGKIAKNEKIVIDTGDGKPIEMKSSDNARIEIKKTRDGQTEFRVTAGTAEVVIDGQKKQLDKTSAAVVHKTVGQVEKVAIEAIKPKRDQVVYSEAPTRIGFAWRWSNDRMPAAEEDYKVEFSSTPGFEKLHATKLVKGNLQTSLAVTESLGFYYRVRGPRGETSQVERVNFVRLRRPFIVKPALKARFITSPEQPFPVEIEFRRPEKMTVTYQIATESEFKEPLQSETTADVKLVQPLPVGLYYIRARGDLGDGHLTSWTEPAPFTIERKVEMLKLGGAPTQERVLIPNRDYPAPLYSAHPGVVKAHVANSGFLRGFFPLEKGKFDELKLQFQGAKGTSQEFSQKSTQWPRDKMRPGRYKYRYQVTKQGFLPTPWSAERDLEIAMEPPRPVGEATYGALQKNGQRDARWNFTPLLFAKSYDVQVSSDSSFNSAQMLKVSEAKASTTLPAGEYYWRARARDAQARIISDYSMPYKLAPQPVEQRLAQKPVEERKPAAVEQTRSRVERIKESPFVKNGWWAWAGAGYNYVDYRQSVKSRGTVSDHRLKGPSEYLETGFVGANNWGGVFSAKYTPGDVNIDQGDGTNFGASYLWTTISMEGILRKVSKFTLYDIPIVYGLRIGVQQHRTPFVFLDSDAALQMKSNEMMTASAGILAEWQRRRWTYYWLVRYQYPLSTKADGANTFSIDPKFAFDGSLGLSYNFTQRFKTGLFWYGQWHQFNFIYGDGTQTNQGFQTLFYSNIDLRFGFDF